MVMRHVSRKLARYCDGQLGPTEARKVEAHLASCARCRAERDEIRFAAGVLRQLKVISPPDALWSSIVSQVDRKERHPGIPGDRGQRGPAMRLRPAWAWAVLVAIATVGTMWVLRTPTRPWQVASLNDGSAVTQTMAAGDWVETDGRSRARITVGMIGTVDVEPGTRVQLGSARPDEYRLVLAGGTISARISAPPRLFVVDTPASTVVDLGCAYTVQVDEAGTGDLRVTEGWASLEWKGRESLVPAGATCRVRGGTGPGTPFFEDASPALREAVTAFDFADGGSAAVATILAEARVRDTLTLWHLLSRVDSSERGRIYDRIAALTPIAPGVDREKALQLDRATLTRWREELAWTW